MKPILAWLLLVNTFFFNAAAQGRTDTVRIASVNDAFNLAVKNNPTQAVLLEQIKVAKYNYRATQGVFYPNVSGSFTGQDNLHLGVTPVPGELIGRPGTTFYAQFGKKYAYNSGISINQDIFDWQSVFETAIAKNNLKLTQLRQDTFVQSLKDQVGKLYYAALIAQASINNSQKDLAYADTLVALARQRLQEGTTDALNVNQSLINANNVKQNLAQSMQLYDQSVETLKILLGVNAASTLLLNEAMNAGTPGIADVTQLGADRNLEVYQQQIAVAEMQSRAQRAYAYPKLSVSGYFGAQQFRNNFGLSFSSDAWNGYRYLGLNLTVPIFTGLTNTYKYKSTLAQRGIARIQYNNAKEQRQINDQLLIKDLANYRTMAAASAQNFNLYGKNLELNKQKYQEGIISMDTYLKTFEDYLKAENTNLNNLSQLFNTWSTILSRQ